MKNKKKMPKKKTKIRSWKQKNADKLWEIKDELKEKYKLNDLKEILAFNEQSDVGGFDVLLERVVDCKLNGTFPSCEACKGRLIKDHNKVKCTSHISSYSRCTFEANLDEVERDKFSMPSKKQIEELKEERKEKKQENKEKEKEMIEKGVSSKKSPKIIFQDLVFFIHDCENKEELQEKIEAAGGSISKTVVKKVTHVISTFDGVEKQNANMKKKQ